MSITIVEAPVYLTVDETVGEITVSSIVKDGLSAYEIWLKQGNVGTETYFIASLSQVGAYTRAESDDRFIKRNPLVVEDNYFIVGDY